MPSTGLNGPYGLSSEEVERVVIRVSPGTYVLDSQNSSDTFIVCYVGRSDDDVSGRIKKWIDSKYLRLKFGYFNSSKAAFEKECEIYHNFKNLDNESHPARPAGSDWKCPECNTFD